MSAEEGKETEELDGEEGQTENGGCSWETGGKNSGSHYRGISRQ